jgi:hypothetical protein
MTQNSALPKEFLYEIDKIVEENAEEDTKMPRPGTNENDPTLTGQLMFKRSFYDYEDASGSGNYNNSSLTMQHSSEIHR